jgi:hypothetical protein
MFPRNGRVGALAVVTVVGLLWLVLTVFTHTLQDWVYGPNLPQKQVELISRMNSLFLICVVPGLVLLTPVLIWTVVEFVAGRVRKSRAVLSCPGCGATESRGGLRFTKEVHKGTEWRTLACPRCQHKWHVR